MSKIPSRRINSPFLIGLFVIFGTVVLIGAILWLGANQFLKERSYYVTYFDGSVEGLETGSAVKYQGVPVGTISTIDVAPDGHLIEIIMSIDKKIDINDKLRAKSEWAGIAGGKFIQLYYPTNEKIAKMFPRFNFPTPHPLIKSSPSGLEEIEIAMRDVINNIRRFEFDKVSDKTQAFLDSTTKFFSNKKMYNTISNLEEATGKLSSIAARADTSRILDFIANSSAMLYQTTIELKGFADKLNMQIDSMKIDYYVGKAFERYDTTMINANKVVMSLGYRSETAMFNLIETMEALKRTNKQLQKSLRAISDHPSQVFLSNPPPEDE